jgi:uncharacterized membrane protein YkvA (DUF1232 family)
MTVSLSDIGRSLNARLRYYQAAYRHPRTPRLSRALLWVALAYLVSPFDIIPDFVPVIGHLDDLVIVLALIWLALWMVPGDVLRECEGSAGTEVQDLQQTVSIIPERGLQ